MSTQKLVMITRADLSAGYQAVQSTHAALDFAADYPDLFKCWHRDSNTVIALEVENETALREQIAILLHRGIHHSTFYEPDIGNELTAIAFIGDENIRSHFKHLKLILKDYERTIK